MGRIPRARKALTRLQTLYDRPVGQRIVDLLLFGPANNGKSRVVEKSRRPLVVAEPLGSTGGLIAGGEMRESLIEA